MTSIDDNAPTGTRPGEGRGGPEHGVVRLHEPIWREMAEPRDGNEPTPIWLVFGAMFLLGWGGWYLGTYGGNFRADTYAEKPSSGVPAPTIPVAVDPLTLGKRVYNNCQACHQADGKGVPGSFPPLDGSEWVLGRGETLARIVLHGVQGPLAVRGVRYEQVMPAWKQLSDEQIAAVLTFIRGSWGNRAAAIAPEVVTAVRTATRGRAQPWTAVELGVANAGAQAAVASLRGQPTEPPVSQ